MARGISAMQSRSKPRAACALSMEIAECRTLAYEGKMWILHRGQYVQQGMWVQTTQQPTIACLTILQYPSTVSEPQYNSAPSICTLNVGFCPLCLKLLKAAAWLCLICGNMSLTTSSQLEACCIGRFGGPKARQQYIRVEKCLSTIKHT